MVKNLEVIGDKVYLNGEHVADLVPGIATSNRWMFRKHLEDNPHVDGGKFSAQVYRKHDQVATSGFAQHIGSRE